MISSRLYALIISSITNRLESSRSLAKRVFELRGQRMNSTSIVQKRLCSYRINAYIVANLETEEKTGLMNLHERLWKFHNYRAEYQ